MGRPKRGTHWANKNGGVYRIVCVTDDDVVVYDDAYNHKIWSKHLDRWHKDMIHLESISTVTATPISR